MTNAEHSSILHYLTWMVLELPVLIQQETHTLHIPPLHDTLTIVVSIGTFYRRSSLALIMLMEHKLDFITQHTMEAMPTMHNSDIMARKIRSEQEATMCIIVKLKVGPKVMHAASELDEGCWLCLECPCALKAILHDFIS